METPIQYAQDMYSKHLFATQDRDMAKRACYVTVNALLDFTLKLSECHDFGKTEVLKNLEFFNSVKTEINNL